MSSMKSIIADAKCQELHAVIDTASDKYLCYTRTEGDQFIIAASNGYDVWRTEIDLGELKAHADLADLSIDRYLAKIRYGNRAPLFLRLYIKFLPRLICPKMFFPTHNVI